MGPTLGRNAALRPDVKYCATIRVMRCLADVFQSVVCDFFRRASTAARRHIALVETGNSPGGMFCKRPFPTTINYILAIFHCPHKYYEIIVQKKRLKDCIKILFMRIDFDRVFYSYLFFWFYSTEYRKGCRARDV